MNARRMLKSVADVVFQNFWWKLLSLAIAVGIWALVASEPEMETSVSVPLEYRDLPAGLDISGITPSTNLVSLELRGPSGELRGLGQNGGLRPGVVLDMSRAQPGQRTYSIGRDNVRLPQKIKLVWARPSLVHFEFEVQKKRTVPVTVRFTGEGNDGYHLAGNTVQPPELEIVGPKSHVERVSSVVTDAVDLSGVVATSEFRVNAFVNDPFVRFESPSQVTVTVTMKKK